MKNIATILAVAALASCASHKPSEYERLSAMPAPASWTTNSVWTFAILDKKQSLIQSMTVRLTDKKGESCSSGDWRHVEILSQQPPPHPQFLGIPAYELRGRVFLMNLTANVCDMDNDLRGDLTETGIAGTYCAGSFLGGECIGSFYGVQVLEDSAPNKPLQRTRSEQRASDQWR